MMLKYVDTKIVFQEIPDEVTLAVNISGCPVHCKGCHSKYLWDDIGEPLDLQHLTDLIDANRGITCVCIMGGDAHPDEVDAIAEDIKEYYPNLKVGWYSGQEEIADSIDLNNFDYIKTGSYKEEFGGLDKTTTNQRMFKVDTINDKTFLMDITAKFWR